MAATKLAISLPRELFEEVERSRKRRGVSRSAAVQTSLRAWLKAERDAERVRRYLDAYRRTPDSDEEVADAARVVATTWAKASPRRRSR